MRTYRKHLARVHHGGRFRCGKCRIEAVFAKDLIQHMEEENHTDDPSVICPGCNDKHHMTDIVDHYEACMKNFYKESYTRRYKELQAKCRMCPTCGKTFSSAAYYHHIYYHHRSEEEGREIYCDQCGKKFKTKQSLKSHVESEHENKEYECPTCKQTFKTAAKRNIHVILEHSTDEKYNCKHCGKRFESTYRLKIHITRVHEPPQFKCQYCGKLFTRKNSLEGHERIHRGEKPYQCTHCPEGFASSHGLCQHLRGVHKIAGKRGGKVGWGHWRKGKQN